LDAIFEQQGGTLVSILTTAKPRSIGGKNQNSNKFLLYGYLQKKNQQNNK
jgi:hypothetical protein